MAVCAMMALAAAPLVNAATDAAEETIKLEKFVVVGSNIPVAGEAPAAPVVSITAEQIENTGITSDLLQVIRKGSPQFSGNGNLGGNNGNISSGSTNGGSALAMRNMATLVLVNGRRLASAPVAATGGGVFVDVNSIPVEAIETMEILTDGASAIYGTDAVSGVVNIKLKSDFEGGLVGGRYAFTNNDGKYRERSAYGIFGASNAKGTTHATASFEWSKTDPIYNIDRSFSRPSYGTTNFAGVVYDKSTKTYYYLDPSLTAPKTGSTWAARGYTAKTTDEIIHLFDLSTYVTQILGNEKRIGTFNVEQKLGGGLTAFGDILYSKTDTQSQLNAQPVSVSMSASDINNPYGVDLSVRNRFIDHPRTYKAKTESLRGVAGLRGSMSDKWSFESAVDWSQGKQDFANGGLIRSAERAAAVSSGKLNLFSRVQDPAVISSILGEAKGKYTSTLTSLDFKLVGQDLIELPGGGVSVAFGGETRDERLKAESDVDSQSATFAYDSGTTIDPFSESRRIDSIFAEARIPLVGKENRVTGIYSANLSLAARHENYDDSDDPTVPKVGLTYQPFGDSFMLRSSFSKSFAAPSLYQLNSPTGIGFSNPLSEFDGNQANQMSVPVTGLKASRSRNVSVGFVWTPAKIKGLTLSVDGFDINQSSLISSLGATGVVDQVFHDVEVNGASSVYAQYVHIGSFTGPTVTKPGQISAEGLDNIYFVIPAASNIGSQRLRGADMKITYSLPLSSGSKLIFDSASTYYSYFDVQVAPTAPYTLTAGRVTGLNGTIARWRTYNTVTYKAKTWSATLGHTFYPATTETTYTANSGWEDYGYYGRVASYSAFDASVSYEFKNWRPILRGLKLTVGVNNIGNAMPAQAATFDGLSNADIGEFSPIGRMVYFQGSYKF